MTARFIALEGGEGCGKTTQAGALAAALGAVHTREPGGTPIGARLRAVLLDVANADMTPRTEALLMAADRAQHMEQVVAPTLASGRHVVSDRSAWSFLAYQGHGRGFDLDELRSLSTWASGGRWPDLAVLLDVPPGEAARRLAAGDAPDRVESESGGFHDRVRAGFLDLAATFPTQWAVIDASGDPTDVAAAVRAAVRERLAV